MTPHSPRPLRRWAGLGLLALAASLSPLLALVEPAPGAVRRPSACRASRLSTAFTLVRGSAGAGSVGYSLRLTNTGSSTCTVSGRPRLQLFGRRGQRLPTHVGPDQVGGRTAVLVTLRPGAVARAEGRFTPDIPDGREPHRGACEPAAVRVKVTLASPGHGSLAGPVSPATPVCQHGAIRLGFLHAARR